LKNKTKIFGCLRWSSISQDQTLTFKLGDLGTCSYICVYTNAVANGVILQLYRGADQSLAQQGRKQATASGVPRNFPGGGVSTNSAEDKDRENGDLGEVAL
jgi:hypothetical protein